MIIKKNCHKYEYNFSEALKDKDDNNKYIKRYTKKLKIFIFWIKLKKNIFVK